MITTEQYQALLASLQTGNILAVQKIANEIFKSTVSIIDTSFCLIAGDENDPGSIAFTIANVNDKQYVSYDLVKLLWEHDLMNQIYHSPREAIVINCGFFEKYPHLATGIFYQNQVLGHLVVSIDSLDFEPWKTDALVTIADAMAVILHQNQCSSMIVEEKELIARELFAGILKPTTLENALQLKIIPKAEHYRVIAVNHIPNNTDTRFLSSDFFYYFDGASYLILLPLHDNSNYQWLYDAIIEAGDYYGLSCEFNHLNQTHTAVLQANQLLEYGLNSTIKKQHWHFEEHALDIIVHHLAQYKEFVHPAIEQLKNFDSLHNTDYLKTIECYIECTMDTLKTAQMMHIHRNSLYYRLEKIKEITQLDLSDSKVIFHLYLSLAILANHSID